MKKLRVGVVGVGALGRHHARIYSELEGVELVAVADSCEERGRTVAKNCRTQWFADPQDLLGCVDAVSIAVPTVAHRSAASPFLEAGIATLIEKPLAANVEDAKALVILAEQHAATLQVGHIERFNPAFQSARPLVGSPKYIRGERLSPFSFRSTDIGVILDVMIHDIDLVLDMVRSPLAHVEAFGISVLGENEDSVQARLRFENGCIADLTANRVNPTSQRSMQVWSDRGCVTVDFSSREVISYSASDRLRYSCQSPLARARKPGADIDKLKAEIFGGYLKVERPDVPQADALTAELSSFVDCVREQRTPQVDGRAALAALEAAERVLDSVGAHRWNGEAGGQVGPFFREESISLRRAA